MNNNDADWPWMIRYPEFIEMLQISLPEGLRAVIGLNLSGLK